MSSMEIDFSKFDVKGWLLKKFPISNYFDKKYQEYIKGKKVLIIGPAPYLKGHGLGKEFDRYDVVIRLNHGINLNETNPEDYGSKTNVLYVNQKMRSHYHNDYPEAWLSKLDVINVIHQRYPLEQMTNCYNCCKKIYQGELIEFVFFDDEDVEDMKKSGTFIHPECSQNYGVKSTSNPNLLVREIGSDIVPSMYYDNYIYNADKLRPDREPPEFILGGMLAFFDVLATTVAGGPSEIRLAGMDFYNNLANKTSVMGNYRDNYKKIYTPEYEIIENQHENECFPHFDQQHNQVKLVNAILDDVANGEYGKISIIVDDHLGKILDKSK